MDEVVFLGLLDMMIECFFHYPESSLPRFSRFRDNLFLPEVVFLEGKVCYVPVHMGWVCGLTRSIKRFSINLISIFFLLFWIGLFRYMNSFVTCVSECRVESYLIEYWAMVCEI